MLGEVSSHRLTSRMGKMGSISLEDELEAFRRPMLLWIATWSVSKADASPVDGQEVQGQSIPSQPILQRHLHLSTRG